MSASFSDLGRLQLAGYASAATGILRSRIHPLVPVAAIDVLAVALALGAMNIVGTMVGGHRADPFLGDIGRTKDDTAPFALVVSPSDATTEIAPTTATLAAVPSVELLFAAPVLIGGPFEAGQGDTVRFVSSDDAASSSGPATGADQPPQSDVAETADPTPDPIPGVSDDPSSPALAKILSIAGRTQARALELASSATAPVIKAAGGRVDLIPLQKYSAASATIEAGDMTAKAAIAAAAPVASSPTTVTTVAAPIQQVAGTVTQPVSQVVSAVGGLLN